MTDIRFWGACRWCGFRFTPIKVACCRKCGKNHVTAPPICGKQ